MAERNNEYVNPVLAQLMAEVALERIREIREAEAHGVAEEVAEVRERDGVAGRRREAVAIQAQER